MNEPATVTLYRPVGQSELDLIEASSWRRFPPRLPEQPIFYPVLTEEYAIRIAREWNTKDARSGFVGYVVEFHVAKDFLDRYSPQTAGGKKYQEYWIPADELEAFNDQILGQIRVLHCFRAASASEP